MVLAAVSSDATFGMCWVRRGGLNEAWALRYRRTLVPGDSSALDSMLIIWGGISCVVSPSSLQVPSMGSVKKLLWYQSGGLTVTALGELEMLALY